MTDKTQAYQRMLREIVRDQGEPCAFSPNAVRLTDAQLSMALRQYDDALAEAAGEILETVTSCLGGNSSYAALFGEPHEAIGTALIAGIRKRLMPTVRNDLKCMASDMELEDQTDDEYARGVTV